jgi:hypothetical protein
MTPRLPAREVLMIVNAGAIIVVSKQGKVEVLTWASGGPGQVHLTPNEAHQLADLIRGEAIVAEYEASKVARVLTEAA